MRLLKAEHGRHSWEIHDLLADFTLEDVWALPTRGDRDEFQALLDLAGPSTRRRRSLAPPASSGAPATR